jgi:hypothetical protein
VGRSHQLTEVMGNAQHLDRDGALEWHRVQPGMAHPVPPAHEIHDRLGPQRSEDGNLLLAAPAAVVEVLVEGFKLDRIPPDPHPEAEAAPAGEIDLRRLLRDEGGLTLRENEYARDQFKRRGGGREISQHDERLMKGVLMAVRSPRERGVLGMIGAPVFPGDSCFSLVSCRCSVVYHWSTGF